MTEELIEAEERKSKTERKGNEERKKKTVNGGT